MTGGSSDVETLAASSESDYSDHEHQDRDGDDEAAAEVVPRIVQGFERPNGAVHDAGDECEKDRECWRHSEKLFHRVHLVGIVIDRDTARYPKPIYHQEESREYRA